MPTGKHRNLGSGDGLGQGDAGGGKSDSPHVTQHGLTQTTTCGRCDPVHPSQQFHPFGGAADGVLRVKRWGGAPPTQTGEF